MTSCVTSIPYSNKEVCAEDGLALGETAQNSASPRAVSGLHSETERTRDSGVSCIRPEAEEVCDVEAYQKSAEIKSMWNSVKGQKNMIIGAGYLLYVVPGILAYFIFQGERSSYVNDASLANNEHYDFCKNEPNVDF